MGRRSIQLMVVAVAATTTLAGCGGGGSSPAGPGGGGSSAGGSAGTGPIVIGAAIATSGFMTSFDTPDMAGFKIAMDEVNAAGGINGRQVQLITADSASTPEGAKKAATDLVARGAQIMLVTANYDVGNPAGQVAEQKNMLNVSLGAASPKYGAQGVGPHAYTIAPPTYLEGAAIAQYAKKQGWNNLFLLDDTSIDYSSEVCAGVKDQAGKLGLKTTEATWQNADQSIASQLTKVKSAGADAIALCSYTPGGATAMRQIRAAGIDLPTLSGIGMAGTYWLKAVPNLSNFYTASTASIFGDDPDPKVNDFVRKFTAATGAAPATDAAVGGYSVGEMIFRALRATNGDTDGTALAAVLDTFANEPLLAGPTTFNPTLHIPADRPMKIIKYTGGKAAYAETINVDGPVDLHLG
jgi:branched-chain amino acid transport system substrate-binding protein